MAIPAAEWPARLAAAAALAAELDALVCTCPNTIHYLTGYATPGNPLTALVLSPGRGAVLVTRFLEVSNAPPGLAWRAYREGEDEVATLAAALHEALRGRDPRGGRDGAYRVGHEAASQRFTVAWHARLQALCPRVGWVDASTALAGLRLRKTPAEVACVREAARYVAAGVAAARAAACAPGATEASVAGEAHRAMMAAGAEYAAYPAFVAAGANGCRAHHAASRARVAPNAPVFLELGAAHCRYHAARMDTVFVGDDAPAWYAPLEAALRLALDRGRRALRPGTPAHAVDAAMRTAVQAWAAQHAGAAPAWAMSERSAYAIGLGCGTDWAEGWRAHPRAADPVPEGATVHLIPWVQLAGFGAVGFSDTALATPGGGVSLFAPEERFRVADGVYHACNPRAGTSADAIEVAAVRGTLDAALAYHARRPPTPLARVEADHDGASEDGAAARVYLKLEGGRMGGRSFKPLGVAFAVDRLLREGTLARGGTVAAMTDGSHGEALAAVAAQQGLRAVVFLPCNVAAEREAALVALGAAVRRVDGTYDDALVAVRAEAAQRGWTLVSDAAWDGYEAIPTAIMCGYVQLFAELLADLHARPTHLFVPAGVGGLLGAAALYRRRFAPDATLVAVEPLDAACLFENACYDGRGRLTARGATDSCMPPHRGTPSIAAWPFVEAGVAHFLALADAHAEDAVRALHDVAPASPSGAAAYAAARVAARTPALAAALGLGPGAIVVCVVSEGVTDQAQYLRILAEA